MYQPSLSLRSEALITSCSSAATKESAHTKITQVQVQCQTFMDTALDTLPLLQQKPHLLATSFPMSIFPECLRHPSALNFTFVTPDPWAELATWSPQLTDLCVGCPTLGHVHWHAGGLLSDALCRAAAMPLTLTNWLMSPCRLSRIGKCYAPPAQ